MSMAVFSNLELYTTFIGWMLYDGFFNVIALTGIAWIPVAYLLFKASTEALESNDVATAGIVAARVARVKLFVSSLVIAFALVPTINLSLSNLNYSCKINGINNSLSCATGGATFGNTGTELDAVHLPQEAAAGVKVPIFWYLMLALSGGINNAALEQLPTTADIASLQAMMAVGRIQDSDVRAELQNFMKDCYLPARARVNQVLSGQAGYSTEQVEQFRQLEKSFGERDMDWPGSTFLIVVPGLYQPCAAGMTYNCAGSGFRATSPVPGWGQDSTRDTEDQYTDSGASTDLPGQPNCDQWWNGDGGVTGLAQKVAVSTARAMLGKGASPDGNYSIDNSATTMGATAQTVIQQVLSSTLGDTTAQVAVDVSARSFAKIGWDSQLRIAPQELLPTSDRTFTVDPSSSTGKSIGDAIFGVFASIGLKILEFVNTMMMSQVQQAGPIFQAIVLMFITMSLPFLMVLTKYELEALITVAVAFLSVRFWTVLFATVQYIYTTFGAMAYQQEYEMDFKNFAANCQQAVGVCGMTVTQLAHSNQATILALVCSAMFILLPALFSGFLSWAGHKVGTQVGGALSSHAGEKSGVGQSTGGGADVAKSLAEKAYGAATASGTK